MSQMILNNKLLQNIYPLFGKINKDYNEYIYIIQMISYYVEGLKEEESPSMKKMQTTSQPLQSNHPFLFFLNHYKINVEMLENILKLEKLNSNQNKKKKKFTVKLKKRLNEYLNHDVISIPMLIKDMDEEEME
jgi:hypothetical protein